MDSPQSVVSPFKSSTVFADSPRGSEVHSKESMVCNTGGSIGVLEVYIHHARDIHNICIYHKQDVYAKICLTSDPDQAVSTQTINGGGRSPVFNQNLSLNVQNLDGSLKCEIWMLSRVRNYLEDQLLGFALVSLSEVVVSNGKLEKEFSLSSTDLFHSPAGFVRLSLSYNGASPEVMEVPPMAKAVASNAAAKELEFIESSSSELDKIEFPDPQVANENQMMVSEYFGIPCADVGSQSSESFATAEAEDNPSREMGALVVESFSKSTDSNQTDKLDSPSLSNVSTNGPMATIESATTKASAKTNESPKSNGSPVSLPVVKEKNSEARDGESYSSTGLTKPVVSVNTEPEQKMVQQDIVDMYMKSMQQFTESLAKMKLPMDIEKGTTNSDNSSNSDQKLQASTTPGARVFYGSRAFF